MKEPAHWEETWQLIERTRSEHECPVDSYGAHTLSDTNTTPDGRFRYLVSLLLSSRTKDPVTAAAMTRLNALLPWLDGPGPELEKAIASFNMGRSSGTSGPKGAKEDAPKLNLTVDAVRQTPEETLAKIIYPVGFYPAKAKNLKRIAEICAETYSGDIPRTMADVLALPGIGNKMANLVMQLCYGEAVGISVDTHVCRISQRLKWACLSRKMQATPDQVMVDLEDWLPREKWAEINPLLVGFGQTVCTPTNPHCDSCALRSAKLCTFVFR